MANQAQQTGSLASHIVLEAKSWVGTPYHPGGRIKGVGVDCAMLLAEVYERAGVVPRIDPGTYPPDFGQHRGEERFKHWLEKHGTLVEDPMPGDVALFRFGRCYSHGAIMIGGGQLVHAVLRDGMVSIGQIDSSDLSDRPVLFYRVNDGR
ncbi:MAG: hypothetical protein DDT25_00525 [Chloroflexi bacterium]|nr:hypothetical protein [Chloroflexota bacterium]